VKELGEPRAVRIHLEHLSEQISAEDEGRGERSFERRWFLPIAPYSSCREGATWQRFVLPLQLQSISASFLAAE